MSRIFISYKRVDKEKVFKIKDQIESALGEKCWIDLDGIESDAQFKNVIIRAINACEIILFMYSKAHSKIVDFEKDWTVRELNFAAKKNKRIVFINLDGSPLTDAFEFDYGTKQKLDGQSSQSLSRLNTELKRWLGIKDPETPITRKKSLKPPPCHKLSFKKGQERHLYPTAETNISLDRMNKPTAEMELNKGCQSPIVY